jgi:undecaprenyl-diphosphatase
MMDTLINADIELLIYLNNLGTEQWDGIWLILSDKFSAIPLYGLLLFLSFKQFGLKKTMWMLLFIAVLITFSDQTSNLFKYGFKRLRPCHDELVVNKIRLVKDYCGGLYSYFSAHASNAISIAIFFGLLLRDKFKYLSVILIIWAVLVAYSRVYIGVHFPLDIITGMLFGLLYGTIFYKLYQSFIKRIIN